MWKLKIIDRLLNKISFEYKFAEFDELATFLLMNDEYNTERCKYWITRD